MPKYEVLGKGHRVNDGTETGRLAEPGEIIDLPEEAAAPFVPWRLKPAGKSRRASKAEAEATDGDAE